MGRYGLPKEERGQIVNSQQLQDMAAMEAAKKFHKGAMAAFGITTLLFVIGTVGTIWFIAS